MNDGAKDSSTFDRVAQLVRETQGRPDKTSIEPAQLLFNDLAFTSMDLLDFLFRVEDTFGVVIAEGTLYRLARGDLADDEFAKGGFLLPVGRERLIALLADTPSALFPAQIDTATLPRYCTVGAIGRLVDHLLAEARGACSS
jgi:acyl carrier protein